MFYPIYIIGPILGAVLAALAYNYMTSEEEASRG